MYGDPNDPITFSLFADITWLAQDTFEGGIIPLEIQKQTGVWVDFTKGTDVQQVPLMIASGDLPELFTISGDNRPSVFDMSSSQYAYSIEELIEEYCPDWVIPQTQLALGRMFSEDGKAYTLRDNFNTADEIRNSQHRILVNQGQLCMRGDIYEALGSPEIHSKDDFFTLLGTIQENYPDMIPLWFNMRNYGGLYQLVGFDGNFPKDANGGYSHTLSDPLYKEFMKSLFELYKAGYIVAENFAMTQDSEMFDPAHNGKIFMYGHFAGNDDVNSTRLISQVIPDAFFIQVFPLENYVNTQAVGGNYSMFITKNCKDPERAIKLKRYAYDNPFLIMYGVEGEDLDWYYPDGDRDAFPVWGARRQGYIDEGATLGDIYRTMNMQLSVVDYIYMNRNFWNSATDRTKEIQTEMQKKIDFNNILPFCAPMPGTDEQVIRTNLDSIRTDYFSMLGTANSEEEFESIYQEMMEQAERAGVEAYNAYISARYNELAAQELFN
ncbi:MAG: hypothetical protein FWH01_15365 [Oscillospiraceae bacterium]|nr:hypothetical protein [Oscillospiraceae bacterium]